MARALNLFLSSLEPPLEEQAQADMIHGCLHSVMALPPEPQGEDGGCQEVLYVPLTLRACLWRLWEGHISDGITWGAGWSGCPSSPCIWKQYVPLKTC